MGAASNLKNARADANLGLREAARKLGRPYETLRGWEQGRGQPEPGDFERMADLYGWSVPELMGLVPWDEGLPDCEVSAGLSAFIGEAVHVRLRVREIAQLAANEARERAEGKRPEAFDSLDYMRELFRIRAAHRDAIMGEKPVRTDEAEGSPERGLDRDGGGVDRGGGDGGVEVGAGEGSLR